MRNLFFWGLLYITILTSSHSAKNIDVNIIFIGNSITQGAIIKDPADFPTNKAVDALRKMKGIRSVNFYNNGVSGSTTVDHLPATNTLWRNTIKAADSFYSEPGRELVFSIMLGTNDSASDGPNGSPVSSAQYQTNLKAIVDNLLQCYPACIVILHHPLWYSPSTYNSSRYLQEGLDRLQSYFPMIDSLACEYQLNDKKVYIGDVKAFSYFKKHYRKDMWAENGQQGIFYLHPNEKGANALGGLWAKKLYSILIKQP